VGQQVKAGQLLAEMEPLDLDQRLKAQEASWVKANSLQNSAKAQVEDARSRLDVASANWLRQNELARQNFISMAALESREQERVSAATAYQIAQANLNAANQDIHRIQADKLAASVLRQSMRLVAPAGAVVISRDAEAGSTVLAGQAVLRLANPGSLWIKTRVDQGRSLGLAVGLPAHIVLRSHPQQHFDGKVQRVEWQSDAVTEERIAQVSFDTMPAGVSMGEMAEVTLSLPPSPPSLLIPQASVQQHQGRTGVWKLKSNHIEFTDVKWGAFSLDGWVQALEGLKVGDEVVVYSEKPLQPNTRFRVVSDLIAKPQS
jgi:HlyD family secretion protein